MVTKQQDDFQKITRAKNKLLVKIIESLAVTYSPLPKSPGADDGGDRCCAGTSNILAEPQTSKPKRIYMYTLSATKINTL